MNIIKPCPFCGSQAVIRGMNAQKYIRCENIACNINPRTRLCNSEIEATMLWNVRANMRDEIMVVAEADLKGVMGDG